MQIRNFLAAIVALTIIGFVSEQSQAQRPNNLFAQYYTPAGASSVSAAMYPAPHPVPHHVGSSYYTYQPLMPHELMYAHNREYYNYNTPPSAYYCGQCGGGNGGYGITRTSVRWQSGVNNIFTLPGVLAPSGKLTYNLLKRKSVAKNPIKRLASCAGGSCGGGLLRSRTSSSQCSTCNEAAACGAGNCAANSTAQPHAVYANWQQQSQAAAARIAAEMQNRYSR